MNIRSVNFKVGFVERLARRLSDYYASIRYCTGQEVLASIEEQAYNPGKDVLNRNFGELTGYFDAKIYPTLEEIGATLNYTKYFHARTRTYRGGDHQDYWLVHSELELKFHQASLFRTLMRFDENGSSLPLDLKGRDATRNRIEDREGNIITDLREFYQFSLE